MRGKRGIWTNRGLLLLLWFRRVFGTVGRGNLDFFSVAVGLGFGNLSWDTFATAPARFPLGAPLLLLFVFLIRRLGDLDDD
jgi:hypothetical protein